MDARTCSGVGGWEFDEGEIKSRKERDRSFQEKG